MQQYRALCKYDDFPGSAAGWVTTYASNPYEATQFLRAQYGSRLIGYAEPVPSWVGQQSWAGAHFS